MNASPIEIANVNYYFGEGALRKQILFDVSARILAGQIVIVTGPSGSGKTTLLTLMGALRSFQEGSIKVLGCELNSARSHTLTQVRRTIGYIFQSHNLLDSLTAGQNVQMSLRLQPKLSRNEARYRSAAMLDAVGLEDRINYLPHQLSGGQKQRVAIARALVSQPKIVLADEPTASLDKQSGRDVVKLLHDLAKQHGTTVVLVTHDNRILDVADRIIHLEDGRLSSFTSAVMAGTEQLMDTLAQINRKGELTRHVRGLSLNQFFDLLAEATDECRRLLRVVEMSNDEAFESMLDQVLESFTLKMGEALHADRASLFLLDEEHDELWSKVAQNDEEKPLEIRIPASAGIVGSVASTGLALNIPDAYAEPLFNPDVDVRTGYRTLSILCVPIQDSENRVFAVAQLLNKEGGHPFDANDKRQFEDFANSIAVVLESWLQMKRRKPIFSE